MSQSLITLTRGFAATCKPQHLTLTNIDHLYSTICSVLVEQPNVVDLIALDALATNLDNHQKKRRTGQTDYIPGQLTMYGKELTP